MSVSLVITAFMMGFFSSAHCVFMCGGIAQALSSQIQSQFVIKTLLFHAGRIACYGMLGLLFGGAIHLFANEYHQLAKWLRHVAGGLLVVIGLYLMGRDRLVKAFEARFTFIWRKVQPIMQRWLPIRKNHQALLVGFLWGFLPCGIIYSTLLWVSATSQSYSAGLLMILFGLGTLPAFALIHLTGLPLVQYLKSHAFRQWAGLLFIVFGVWTILAVSPALMPIKPPFCIDP